MIYNFAKPGINKITDAIVDAGNNAWWNADEKIEENERYMEMQRKQDIATLKSAGATWLNSDDSQSVVDQARLVVSTAKKYGVVPDSFRAYADMSSWDDAVAWAKGELKSKAQEVLPSISTKWGNDLSTNMANGILDGKGPVVAAATAVASPHTPMWQCLQIPITRISAGRSWK